MTAVLPWICVLSAALVAGWAISFLSERGSRVLRVIPFVLVVALVLLIMARERSSNGLGLLSPLGIAAVTYLLMFAVVPLFDIRYNNPMIHQEAWWRGSWFVFFGLCSLYLGYRLVLMVYPSVDLRLDYQWYSQPARTISLVLLVIALGSLLVEFSSIGLDTYIVKFAQRHTLVKNGVPLLIRITMATPAVLLLAGNWLQRPTRRRLLFILLVVLPPAIFASGFLGQRWRALTLIVALIAIYHVGFRRLPRFLIAGMVLAMAVLFVGYGTERSSLGTQRQGPTLQGDNFYFNYLSKHEVGQFRDFVVTLGGVPSRLPFQHGRTYLALIPGAPFPTASFLYSTTFYPQLYSRGTSIPTPLPGELYLNFGPWGIFVGMIVFGGFLALLESYFRRHRGSIGAVLIYAYSLVPIAGILRGDFTTFAGYFALGMIPLVVSLKYVERAAASGRTDVGFQRQQSLRVPEAAEPTPL